MMSLESDIDNFFSQYAARFNWALWEGQFDTEGIAQAFADDFVAANPLGIQAGKNDSTFREAISQGWSFYRELGIHSMNIVTKSITPLDAFHAMVKLRWQSLYVTKDERSGEIEFDVIYLLQLRAESIKIFAYIIGDEQQGLKDAGLFMNPHLSKENRL